MRTCMFCRVALNKSNRAKEHVLRNSWLKKLGHRKTVLKVDSLYKSRRKTTIRIAADQLQAGEVCKNCNGGWMNTLDTKVSHLILGLSSKPNKINFLDEIETIDLARWLLKTACTSVLQMQNIGGIFLI